MSLQLAAAGGWQDPRRKQNKREEREIGGTSDEREEQHTTTTTTTTTTQQHTNDATRSIRTHHVNSNKAAVDADLVELIAAPSNDANALDVFVSVITGPPGPKPWELLPRIAAPLFIAWGCARKAKALGAGRLPGVCFLIPP